MALLRASLTWCRRSLGWSNSTRSWLERGSALNVLASALVLWGLGFWLGARPLTLVVLWSAWIVSVAVLVRSGYLQLFGPVLFYDMIRTARRNRYAMLRFLYACFLLLILFSVHSGQHPVRGNDRQQASRLASDYFEWFIFVQLVAVGLLTPAYVGGAVSEEKERHTLEFILATDLRSQEIILSKLGSRLANLTLFLLTGLPILSLLQFLGGIDPNLVLMGFAATGLTMLGLASVSLVYSVLMRRPRDAIGLTYLFGIAYLAGATTLYVFHRMPSSPAWMNTPLWFGASPPTVRDLTIVLNAGNPLILMVEVKEAGRAGTLATTLPTLLRNYATFQLVLSGLCLGFSILRLRPVGLKQTVGREIKSRDSRRSRPPVGEMPMVWKELLDGRQRLGWAGWLTFIPLAALTMGIGLYICSDLLLLHLGDLMSGGWLYRSNAWNGNGRITEEINAWARISGTGVACFTFLWTAVRASTSISGERDKQTLDALITTQLESDAILGAKLYGSLLGIRVGLLWLAAILALACLTGGLHPLALPLVLGAWLLYACFFSMVGLWFSMVCTTSTKATVTTVMVSLFLGAGHWMIWLCLGPLLFFSHGGTDSPAEFLMKFQTGMTPPAVMALFMFSYRDLGHDFGRNHYGELLAYCMLGAVLWSAACFALWYGLLVPRFRAIMRREPGLPD
jgi:ABC-type transport system involved in multi-copper enzyme maturation permease subunit